MPDEVPVPEVVVQPPHEAALAARRGAAMRTRDHARGL
jgi:hypothetical protein